MQYIVKGQNVVGKTLIVPAWMAQRFTQGAAAVGVPSVVTYCGHTAYVKVG